MNTSPLSPDPTKDVPTGRRPKAARIVIRNSVIDPTKGEDIQEVIIDLEEPADDNLYTVTVTIGDNASTLTVSSDEPNPTILEGLNVGTQFPTTGNDLEGTVNWDQFPPEGELPFVPVTFEEGLADEVTTKKKSFLGRIFSAIANFFSSIFGGKRS